jgi:hypothetical protein
MRGFFLTVLAASLVTLILAAPKPASALPAAAALDYSHANASSDLVEVKKWYKKRYYRPYRYARPYRYRPYYYRPYRYYSPYYYRPYYRRPGVSIWFGW